MNAWFLLNDVRIARIRVLGSIKLKESHVVLLWTIGWMGGHLHAFATGQDHDGAPGRYLEEIPRMQRNDRVSLAAALGTVKHFTDLYDYRGGWDHQAMPP